MTGSRRIHWSVPCSIAVAFLSALLLAIGHHLFYLSRAGRVAAGADFDILVAQVSQQQFNTVIGTAFAFLVKSMLGTAIATSYWQVFWRVLVASKKGVPVRDIDTAHSMLQDVLSLFKSVLIWWRSLLLPFALVFWLIPLASIFTPGTLSVQSRLQLPPPTSQAPVPQFDFVNPSFANVNLQLPGENPNHLNGSELNYEGASSLMQRVAAAAAGQGAILQIPPPAPNATWSLEFWGPSMQCNNVSGSLRTDILSNYGTYLQGSSNQNSTEIGDDLSYFSWVGIMHSILPVGDTSMLPFAVNTRNYMFSETNLTFVGFSGQSNGPLFIATDPHNWMNRDAGSWGKAPDFDSVLQNVTILRCDLFNSSYDAHFEYTNGEQRIVVNKNASPSINVPITPDTEFLIPSGPFVDWDTKPTTEQIANWNSTFGCNGTNNSCFDQSKVRQMAYQAIDDAFKTLVVGTIDAELSITTSQVIDTVLLETTELRSLFDSDSLPVEAVTRISPAFHNLPASALLGTRGSLANALEQLFENITISTLSEPILQPNFSHPGAPSAMANVSSETYHNVYVYNSQVLWTAYGLAIFFTALVIILGSAAMWTSGVAYDSHFSTILRFSRQADLADEHGTQDESAGDSRDDISAPMPVRFKKAVLVMRPSPVYEHASPVADKDHASAEEPVESLQTGLLATSTPQP